jgi:DNA modification methylase
MNLNVLAAKMPPIQPSRRGEANRLEAEDRPVHDWYRFILSYPPHLVRKYLDEFGVTEGEIVLDPFCGTGTTMVECQKRGVSGVGIEAHPLSHFASATKLDWRVEPAELESEAMLIAERAGNILERQGIIDDPQPALLRELPSPAVLRTLPEEAAKLLLSGSISPLPLHKTLVLLDLIDQARIGRSHLRLALAKALVSSISNLEFGPEVGVGKQKEDAPVISSWLGNVARMVDDLGTLSGMEQPGSVAHHADARDMTRLAPARSVAAVITSPPYPNEKDYTRTTRLETVLLGFIRDKPSMRALKRTMLRSNTRGVYVGDADDRFVAGHREIQRIATEIEERRLEMGKTSGFERLYARVTKLYFGGMVRHLSELRRVLRPGARLAYVVGDQASYLRIMIRTGHILGSLAEELGYEVERIDLFRTRLATATREQLREEVVVLRWRGER